MTPLYIVVAPVCALILVGALMGAAIVGAAIFRLAAEVFRG